MSNTVDIKELLRQKKLARQRKERAEHQTDELDSSKNLSLEDSEQELSKRLKEIALVEHLRPYQAEDVLVTLSNYKAGRPTLNASKMGLGKTREAAAFLATVKAKLTLWLTAKTLVKSTTRQLSALGVPVFAITDPSTLDLILPVAKAMIHPVTGQGPILVMNYEALRQKKAGPIILSNEWPFVVIDEVSKVKGGANLNGSTLIWRLVKDLLHPELRSHKHYPEPALRELPKPYPLFLSGTPVENRPGEMWAYLHLFDPERFKSLSSFEAMFSSGLVVNTEYLFEILSHYVIRRTPESIGFQLPPLTTDRIEVELPKDSEVYKIYRQLVEQAVASLESQHATITVNMLLEELLRCRQILQTGPTFTFTKVINPETKEKLTQTIDINGPYPKLDAAEEKIWSLLNEGKGEQVVVFSCFNQPLQELAKRFSMFTKVQVIDGSTSKNMNEYEQAFQQGEIQILFINKRTGSQGLNLQKCADWPGGASYAIHLDEWWNPAVEDQANARLLRMNSTSPVTVYYFYHERTVDELIHEIVCLKSQSADMISDAVTIDKQWVLERLL